MADRLPKTGHIAGEQRNLGSQKLRVLSRKALERTLLLKTASRHMIDTSKALVSAFQKSKQTRGSNPVQLASGQGA